MIDVGEVVRDVGTRKIVKRKGSSIKFTFSKDYDYLYRQAVDDTVIFWKQKIKSNSAQKIKVCKSDKYSCTLALIGKILEEQLVYIVETDKAFVVTPADKEKHGLRERQIKATTKNEVYFEGSRKMFFSRAENSVLGNGWIKCTYCCSDELGYRMELVKCSEPNEKHDNKKASNLLKENGFVVVYYKPSLYMYINPFFAKTCNIKLDSYYPFEIKENRVILTFPNPEKKLSSEMPIIKADVGKMICEIGIRRISRCSRSSVLSVGCAKQYYCLYQEKPKLRYYNYYICFAFIDEGKLSN